MDYLLQLGTVTDLFVALARNLGAHRLSRWGGVCRKDISPHSSYDVCNCQLSFSLCVIPLHKLQATHCFSKEPLDQPRGQTHGLVPVSPYFIWLHCTAFSVPRSIKLSFDTCTRFSFLLVWAL